MGLRERIEKRGLFEAIFGTRPTPQVDVAGWFKTLSSYTPIFTSRDGGLYEMELTRAAIHAKAKHRAKLKPEVLGAANPALKSLLQFKPNPFMDTTKFLYRLSTILDTDTTTFIVPLLDPTGTTIVGFYPILPAMTEVVSVSEKPWLRYRFTNGQVAAVEFERVGILTTHQYRDDFFGSGHSALNGTLDLVHIQQQGMADAVKNSAAIRFLARLSGTLRPEDIKAERDRWSQDNLAADNASGVAMFDAKYADVKQITSNPWLIDADQMKLIQTNVFNYFGVNEAILQNTQDENAWNAFYEGEIEGFALQLGLVMSNMTFSDRERAFGNSIMFSANRLQYASNTTKLAVTTQLMDRGILSNYAAADVWNLPQPVGEERWVIRGEYIDVTNLPDHTVGDARSYLPVGQPVPAPASVLADPPAPADQNGA